MAIVLRLEAVEAAIAACRALCGEVEPLVHLAERRLGSYHLARRLLEREYDGLTLDGALKELEDVDKMDLILSDDLGERAVMEWLGEVAKNDGEFASTARAAGSLWLLVRECALEHERCQKKTQTLTRRRSKLVPGGLDAFETSERFVLGESEISKVPPKHVRQLIVGLVWWAKHEPQCRIVDEIFGGEAAALLEKDGAWTNARVAELIGSLRSGLRVCMADELHVLFASPAWRRRQQEERLKISLNDKNGREALARFLEGDKNDLPSDAREALEEQLLRAKKRNDDGPFLAKKEEDQDQSGDKVRLAAMALESHFWGSRPWMRWMNERRRRRIGEALPLAEATGDLGDLLQRKIPGGKTPDEVAKSLRGRWQKIDAERRDAEEERDAALLMMAQMAAIRLERAARGFGARRRYKALRFEKKLANFAMTFAKRSLLFSRDTFPPSTKLPKPDTSSREPAALNMQAARQTARVVAVHSTEPKNNDKVRARMKKLREDFRRERRGEFEAQARAKQIADEEAAHEKREEKKRRRAPLTVFDADHGTALTLNERMWCHRGIIRTLPPPRTEKPPPEESPRTLVPWAKLPAFDHELPAFDHEVPFVDPCVAFLGMKYRGDALLRAKRCETPAHERPFRLLGVQFDPKKKLRLQCRQHHAAMKQSVLAEMRQERQRRAELSSLSTLKNKNSTTAALTKSHDRARRQGRTKLQRLQHDHQTLMVMNLRDAGLLR